MTFFAVVTCWLDPWRRTASFEVGRTTDEALQEGAIWPKEDQR